ncbi:MAG: hypothetical protein HY204_03145 [Nitrospirae bacterium]|nr:hypothetical protein [Nitrospirota bacterium]
MEKRAESKLVLLVLGCGLAIVLPIYFSWHPYSPKSFVALLLGIIGSVMMVFGALLYALRKRIKVLRSLGKMSVWLDVHITLCILGPLLVVYHTGFMVKSPNAAIAFYVMLIVVASGVIGRYIYRHFQFSLSGERATLKEITQEIDQLDQQISQRFSESQTILGTIRIFFELRDKQKSHGPLRSFFLMVRLDRLEKKLKRQIGRLLRQQGGMPAFNKMENQGSFETVLIKRINLEKKISALETTTKLFAYWHKLHVPFIWILAFTLIVHIAAVLIF